MKKSKIKMMESKRTEGRHDFYIAMGGCIGTGLFMTSGEQYDAGALGALIAYGVELVFFLMTSLGEMATCYQCLVHLVLTQHVLQIHL